MPCSIWYDDSCTQIILEHRVSIVRRRWNLNVRVEMEWIIRGKYFKRKGQRWAERNLNNKINPFVQFRARRDSHTRNRCIALWHFEWNYFKVIRVLLVPLMTWPKVMKADVIRDHSWMNWTIRKLFYCIVPVFAFLLHGVRVFTLINAYLMFMIKLDFFPYWRGFV